MADLMGQTDMEDATPEGDQRLDDSKTCSSCGLTRSRQAFNKRARSVDGLQAWCRNCEHAYAAERRKTKSDDERERGRRWRAANPERARAATRRQYRATADARRASSQLWREHNPEKVKVAFAAWRAANVEYDRARNRQYQLEHPEVARAQSRRRRARKTANGPVENFADIEIAERDNWTCQLCAAPVDPAFRWPHPQAPVIDHVVPIVLGGPHTRANVQLAHQLCNARKGARAGVTDGVSSATTGAQASQAGSGTEAGPTADGSRAVVSR